MKNETLENGIFGGMSAAKSALKFIKNAVVVVVLLLAILGSYVFVTADLRNHVIDYSQHQDPKVAEVTE